MIECICDAYDYNYANYLMIDCISDAYEYNYANYALTLQMQNASGEKWGGQTLYVDAQSGGPKLLSHVIQQNALPPTYQ